MMFPWPLKIIIKLCLAPIPNRHKLMRQLGIFKHGAMDDVHYAHKIFQIHAKAAFGDEIPEGLTCLELGPGDSVLSALIANAYGFKKIYLSDAGDYVSRDMAFYKEAARNLREAYKLNIIDIESTNDFNGLLSRLNASYLPNGLTGLQKIPENSVDFIWSHSVLEHVSRLSFAETMSELTRVLYAEGVISHNVDLQDHLNYGLNHMRFPAWFWENSYVAAAGFYTNRLTYAEHIEKITATGLLASNLKQGRWPKMPLSKAKLHKAFQGFDEENLEIRTYSGIFTKQ